MYKLRKKYCFFSLQLKHSLLQMTHGTEQMRLDEVQDRKKGRINWCWLVTGKEPFNKCTLA